VASIYLPNGNPSDDPVKYPYKLAWMERLRLHAESLLLLEEPLILAGDYNVIPEPHDCFDPAVWATDALFLPQTRAAFRSSTSEQVIARNDMVRVTYQVGGVSLSVMGKAMRNAALGEPVAVMNLGSNRLIDAVASGPGQAIAGPAADMARANPQQFAAR